MCARWCESLLPDLTKDIQYAPKTTSQTAAPKKLSSAEDPGGKLLLLPWISRQPSTSFFDSGGDRMLRTRHTHRCDLSPSGSWLPGPNKQGSWKEEDKFQEERWRKIWPGQKEEIQGQGQQQQQQQGIKEELVWKGERSALFRGWEMARSGFFQKDTACVDTHVCTYVECILMCCVCVCVRVCVCVCEIVYACMCVMYIHASVWVASLSFLCLSARVCMHNIVHVYIHTYIHTYVYVCVCVCVCIYIYIYIYICIYGVQLSQSFQHMHTHMCLCFIHTCVCVYACARDRQTRRLRSMHAYIHAHTQGKIKKTDADADAYDTHMRSARPTYDPHTYIHAHMHTCTHAHMHRARPKRKMQKPTSYWGASARPYPVAKRTHLARNLSTLLLVSFPVKNWACSFSCEIFWMVIFSCGHFLTTWQVSLKLSRGVNTCQCATCMCVYVC